MKIKTITLNNFAKYDQVTVSFDNNVTYLIGKNGSGKSTLGITAIWFMFQGIAEKASNGNNPLIGERFRFIGTEVDDFLEQIKAAIKTLKNAADLYPTEPEYAQELPDDSELKAIDQQIIEASETNRKALLYEQYIEKKQQKEAKAQELADNKKKQDAKEQERIDYIKAFKFPFSNLSVDDEGQLLLAGKPIKDPYFSTGELLKIIPILLSTSNPELKYVFVQGFNDLDEDNWKQVEEYLLGKGFQLVIEMVGKEKLTDKNCILLKDNIIIETYEQEKTPELI